MKRLIVGYLQEEMIKFNLGIKDLLILRFIVNFIKSDAPYKREINGKTFYWIKVGYILEELPGLEIKSKRVLMRRIKKLIDGGLLEYNLLKKGGMYTLFAIGENYEALLSKDEKESMSKILKGGEKKSRGKKVIEGDKSIKDRKVKEEIVREKDFSRLKGGYLKGQRGGTLRFSPRNLKVLAKNKERNIEVKDNKYIKNILKEVVTYLNKKIGSSYKENSKNIFRLISERIIEGFYLEDFKKVIDKKVEEWSGTIYEKYLRPSTLFSESKFEEYLNQKMIKVKVEEASTGYYDYF